MTSAEPVECPCIDNVNKLLAEHDAELVHNILSLPRRVAVEVISTKKRGRKPVMMATYCPFCGRRYAEGRDLNTRTLSAMKDLP